MLSLSDRLTVPQVFFNDHHIGGADETLNFLQRIQQESPTGTAADEYYKAHIASKPDPTDPRLAVPTTPPVQETPAPPRDAEHSVPLPNGQKATVLQVVQLLRTVLPRANLKHNLTVYKNCFRGDEAVVAFQATFPEIRTDQDAVAFGKMLLNRKIIRHVAEEKHFIHSKNRYYRLHCYHKPHVLNSYRVWSERVDPDCMSLVKRLKTMLGRVQSAVTDRAGRVNYSKAKNQELYPVFEEAVCELQGVDMAQMNERTKLAFGINLYNMMIQYAFMKVGIGTSFLTRNSFFGSVYFNVGGKLLSFNDLEHGVLRANRKGPANFSVSFAKDDTRLAMARKEVDCRIHFALNCGAKSCPPVKTFTVQAIEEELRIVTQAFCEQEDNVSIDVSTRTLYLSSILNWFQVDFCKTKADLPGVVVNYLRGEKQRQLQELIENGNSINIKFKEYDWSTDASYFVPFEKSVLVANFKTVKALF